MRQLSWAFVVFFCLFTRAWAAEDTLRVGLTALPDSMGDPHRSVSVFSSYSWVPVFETLTAFNADGTLGPQLATDWHSISPTTWTFDLRKDVVFSNGVPFTANAVVKILEYLKTPEGRAAALSREFSTVSQVEALDTHTVQIHTYDPDIVLPRKLTTMYIVEPQAWVELGADGFATEPVGTGPFKVTKWTSSKIEYEMNPLAWRRPRVSGLEIFELRELMARVNALLTDRLDIVIGLGPDDIPLVESAGGKIHRRDPIDVISITFVIGQGHPVDDIRVRKALNYAVNKESITRVLLENLTKPATQGAVRGLLGYNTDLTAYRYDPELAKKLLAEAGYAEGFSLETEVIIGSNANDAAIYQLVTADLAKVGVSFQARPIPNGQMAKIVLQGEWRGEAFSQIFGSWPAFEPMRTLRTHSCLHSNPWYCDEQIIPTMRAAMTAPTLEARINLTQKVLAFYHEQATSILLHEIPLLDGLGPRVRDYAPKKGKINYEAIWLEN